MGGSREETAGTGRRACGVPGRQWGGQIQEACGQARGPGKSLWLQSGLALLLCTQPLTWRVWPAICRAVSPKGLSFIAPHLHDPPNPIELYFRNLIFKLGTSAFLFSSSPLFCHLSFCSQNISSTFLTDALTSLFTNPSCSSFLSQPDSPSG